MRFSSLTSWIFALLLLVGVSACKFSTPGASVQDVGSGSAVVGTTYYPYDANDAMNMGPGHFSCSQYNSETQWYVAPSDTFGDSKLWTGPPCAPNPNGGPPACSVVMTTCGVKVKISCASNCKAGAPDVVAMITDVCPKNHPQNKISGACQGGAHFDIGKPIWELMHNANDNISVRYEVVDGSTPLGPTSGGSSSPTAGPTQPANSAGTQASAAQTIISATPNYVQPVTTTPTPGITPIYAAPGLPTPPVAAPSPPSPIAAPSRSGDVNKTQWCDPYKTTYCFPYCTNGSNTGQGFGWQPALGGPNGGSCRVP